jgi:hypothetical protein
MGRLITLPRDMPEKKTPQVRFYSHACIAIEGERDTLLTDPWFFGDVFHDSWTLLAPLDIDTIDFNRVRHIWISHAHPDHLHFPSLRLIRERVSGPITVYYRREKDSRVHDALTRLGFDIVELEPHKETIIAEDITGTMFPAGYDSALVIRANTRVILNLNDCTLSQMEIDSLKRMFPRVDAMFYQFSPGGYNPNQLQLTRELFLRKLDRLFIAVRPALFVPFASFFYFSKEENAYLNDWIITLDDIVDALPHLPTQILYTGDVLLWQQWQARNDLNLVRWREAMHAPKKIKPHADVDEVDILAAGQRLVRDVVTRGLTGYGPGEMHLKIRETGQAVAIDFRCGRFVILDRPNPQKLVLTVPGEDLLVFLKAPIGGAALYFSSCLHVVDLEKWERLQSFRDSLSLDTAKLHVSYMKSFIAKLDRKYFGAILGRGYAKVKTRLPTQ